MSPTSCSHHPAVQHNQSTKLDVTAVPRKASHCAIGPLLPRQLGHCFHAILTPGPWDGRGFICTFICLFLLAPVGRKPAWSLAKPTFSPTVQPPLMLQVGHCAAVCIALSKRFISPCFLRLISSMVFYIDLRPTSIFFQSVSAPLNTVNHQLIFTQLISSSQHRHLYFAHHLPLLP